MWKWLPPVLMYVSLALLILAEERDPADLRQIKIWKPLCTILVIVTAALSFARPEGSFDTLYSVLILVGLVFSLAGDVLLIYQNNATAFLWGLVAFLLAHVMYIAAFVYLQASFLKDTNIIGEVVAGLALLLIGSAVYRFLSPGLGKMRGPVIAYIIVISLMVQRALSIAIVHPGPAVQPTLIVVGASLFYLSDAILAVNKFRMDGTMPHYRFWNLSTYYTGQLLIALSTWFLP